MVELTKSEYNELKLAERKLGFLMRGRVVNWEHYDNALETRDQFGKTYQDYVSENQSAKLGFDEKIMAQMRYDVNFKDMDPKCWDTLYKELSECNKRWLQHTNDSLHVTEEVYVYRSRQYHVYFSLESGSIIDFRENLNYSGVGLMSTREYS